MEVPPRNEKEEPLGYPVVQIHNATTFNVGGEVKYATFFCSNDDYSATPDTTWSASSRGACLVTGITATVKTPQGDIVATAYSSSGTSYSQFAVLQTGPGKFEVTRRVTMEDEKPVDYVAPTSQQK